MAITSEEIIRTIERDYPQTNPVHEICNCSDLDIEGNIRYVHQYIIGLSNRDPMNADIGYYRMNMEKQLAQVGLGCKCLAWSFEDYDLETTKEVLKELSDHFSANLDTGRMIQRLNMKKANGEMYFIVVTIVFIPVVSVE